MKNSISLIFFLVAQFASGQDASENMKQLVFANPFHSSNQQYMSILNKKNEERDLSDYLEFDDWKFMEVVGLENTYLTIDSANFFIPDGKIVFIRNGIMMELFPELITKIRIDGKNFIPFLEEKGGKKARFYEFLAGEQFKVLSTKLLNEESKDIHPMGLNTNETQLVVRKKYYYVSAGDDYVTAVPRSKTKFLRVFKKHKKKMLEYVKKRNLSSSVENDLIRIARYYNLLLH